MHTLNKRVLDNLIHKYIHPLIVEDKIVLNDWTSFTGVHPRPGVIEPDGKPAVKMQLGDVWRVGYDDTRFFETNLTVPPHFAGRKCYLSFDFGGEAIVRINGKIVGAVSSRANSGWVGRDEILFSSPLAAGETLHIQLEAAVDCGGFCDRAMAGGTYMQYELKKAELQLINEATESFYFDITCAWAVMENTEDPYVAKRLFNAIDDAAHIPDYDAGKARFYADVPAAAALLRDRLDKIPYASPGRIIMTGHSHLDIAWLWTTNELTRKTARTFANTLALMDNYPDFKFTQSQAAVYWFIKEYYPELYPRIKEAVKNGRWEIVGNTWVEADTNIASGESLVRQLLYGREFFMKEFGVSSDIYWLPDCFGFTAALPQIIRRSGMKYFYTSKLSNNDTNVFPMNVFKWRSHSGDEVLAYMQNAGYNSAADADYVFSLRAKNRQNDLVDAYMGNFGYGDGGGGCTYRMVEKLHRFQKMPGIPQVTMGTAKEFFAEVEKAADTLPVWDGEMYYENHRGTFTSQAFVKENNRRGEYLLRDCELLGVLAGAYDKERLERLWQILLTNQFHDILPGTSIHEVFENTKEEYARFRADSNALKAGLLADLSGAYAAKNGITVWNLLPRAVSGSVKVKIPAGFSGITTAGGQALPCAVYEGADGCEMEFLAENVPAVGCKTFQLTAAASKETSVTAERDLLENAYLRVRFDPQGNILSCFDKENGREVLSSPGNLLSISHDKPIHESAWNLESDYKLHMDYLTKASSVEVLESSPVKGVLHVVHTYNRSVITQDITLYAGAKRLDFVTHTNWQEREKVLKAEFPVNIRARYSAFEIAHGATERPTFANNSFEQAMFECCAHKWVDLSEGDYGVALLNNCKYGHDVTDGLLRITLMRGPVCPDPKGDIGEQDFIYSLYPHAGKWNDAQVVWEAQKLNEPLTAVYTSAGTGTAPGHSYLSVDRPDIVLDAVKQAQDGEGVILRVYEAEQKHTEVTLMLPFAPKACYECNLMEENEKELPVAGDRLRFSIKPFEVKTFRII